jgi:hypothetical protein
VAILEIEHPPLYQRIAGQANRLRQLGLSDRATARHLGTDNKLVAKAIRWWSARAKRRD